MDNAGVAKAATVRALSGSVNNLGSRMDKLEGAVSENARRMQSQGTSFETLAKVVSSLGDTIKEGFAEIKAIRSEAGAAIVVPTSVAGEAMAAPNEQAPAAVAGADKGFRTGRTIRGANPEVPTDDVATTVRDAAAIRRMMNSDLTSRTGWAVVNSDVYLGPDAVSDLMVDKAMDQRKDDASDAELWLMTPYAKPRQTNARSLKGKGRVETTKPFVSLGQVLPHLIEALKKRGTVAYFKSIGVPIDELTDEVAQRWFKHDEYTASTAGKKGIRAAMEMN